MVFLFPKVRRLKTSSIGFVIGDPARVGYSDWFGHVVEKRITQSLCWRNGIKSIGFPIVAWLR